MILPRLIDQSEWLKPELIDVLLTHLLMTNEEDKDPELSRIKAKLLFHLIVQTKSERAEELV